METGTGTTSAAAAAPAATPAAAPAAAAGAGTKTDVPENANTGSYPAGAAPCCAVCLTCSAPRAHGTGCVGTHSDAAGKASSCAGCPNQAACASGAGRKVDPTVKEVADQLASVRHIILVLSGKGGVGKSTVSAQLAFTLAAQGKQVGLLDVDICGPSIPRMLGLTGREVHQNGSGWSPVWLDDNLGVMSIGFVLPGSDEAVIWRGPRKSGLIKNFLKDVQWGDLDYLIIDTPPGTSDEHISVVQYLKGCNVDGAVVVTTPQEIAMADVRKELNFCKKVHLPVLGVVENMSGFVCPCCKTATDIFARPASGGPETMAAAFGVPFLGAVPMDPTMLASCETGVPFVVKHPDAPAAKPFLKVVAGVVAAVEGGEARDDKK